MKNKLIKFFIILIFTFIFSETLLYFVKDPALEFFQIQKSYHKFDPDYLIDFEANVRAQVNHYQKFFKMNFSTNKMAFRGIREVDNSIPQIACVGDSIVMGFGVDDKETFCAKLDEHLEKYQAINMGVDAYGPAQIFVRLKKLLPKLNVKLMYYFPSTGDDIDDRAYFQKMQSKKEYYAFKTQFLASKHSYSFLGFRIVEEHIQFRFRENFIDPFTKLSHTIKCNSGKVPSDECGNIYTFPTWSYIVSSFLRPPAFKIPTEPPQFPKNECDDTPPSYKIPKQTLESIDKIVRITEEHNIKLIMVLAPLDIETAYCSQKGKYHKLSSYLYTLKDYLENKNISYIELTKYTDKMTDKTGRLNSRLYYLFGDGHYTPKGHEWIYKTLYQKTSEVLD